VQASIVKWLNKPLDLLENNKDRWILIITTGVFSILFLNLYNPFNVSNWHSIESLPLFLILSSYGIIGILILSISQFLIRPLFGIKDFKIGSFILWFICEVIILGFFMFLIYGDKGLQGYDLLMEILRSLKYTFLVIALPYAAVLYYLHSSKQKQKYYQVDKSEKNIIKILDENQNVRIAIEPDKLLFIKNADNYVEIFYANNEGISKELVRTSLKRLESELKDFKVMRCHRSYMVNIKNVSLSKKTRKGLNLELRIENAPLIPVSKNYASDILTEL
jgi:hypothetical protein